MLSTTGVTQDRILDSRCLRIPLINTKTKTKEIKSWTNLASSFPWLIIWRTKRWIYFRTNILATSFKSITLRVDFPLRIWTPLINHQELKMPTGYIGEIFYRNEYPWSPLYTSREISQTEVTTPCFYAWKSIEISKPLISSAPRDFEWNLKRFVTRLLPQNFNISKC